jgi:hypothetical protein
MLRFTIEMDRVGHGIVAVRVRETEDNGLMYEVTVALDSTREAQKQALQDVFRHLNRFTDLSHGGTK